MNILAVCIILGACSSPHAEEDLNLGRTEPPYVEATAIIPTKLIYVPEKRAGMVADLAEKSEMNYRLLALKIMEKWQSLIRSDKEFLKNIRKCKTVSFMVHEDGSIAIKGIEDTAAPNSKSSRPGGTKDSANSSSAPAKTASEN